MDTNKIWYDYVTRYRFQCLEMGCVCWLTRVCRKEKLNMEANDRELPENTETLIDFFIIYADGSLLFVFLLTYLFSLITLGFLVSSFFSTGILSYFWGLSKFIFYSFTFYLFNTFHSKLRINGVRSDILCDLFSLHIFTTQVSNKNKAKLWTDRKTWNGWPNHIELIMISGTMNLQKDRFWLPVFFPILEWRSVVRSLPCLRVLVLEFSGVLLPKVFVCLFFLQSTPISKGYFVDWGWGTFKESMEEKS